MKSAREKIEAEIRRVGDKHSGPSDTRGPCVKCAYVRGLNFALSCLPKPPKRRTQKKDGKK